MNITGQITEHFSVEEFANPASGEEIQGVMNPQVFAFAKLMEDVRAYIVSRGWAKYAKVNSWYRTEAFNRDVAHGIPNSLHLQGLAMDVKLKLDDAQFAELASFFSAVCANRGAPGEIGLYESWIHFGWPIAYQLDTYIYDAR